ncbi:hypothetical protein OH77DRAFT_243878 [Trametes cingulata]|nr:hypothetical protein OH77DRAFT_243878 [Trametes cingulata]
MHCAQMLFALSNNIARNAWSTLWTLHGTGGYPQIGYAPSQSRAATRDDRNRPAPVPEQCQVHPQTIDPSARTFNGRGEAKREVRMNGMGSRRETTRMYHLVSRCARPYHSHEFRKTLWIPHSQESRTIACGPPRRVGPHARLTECDGFGDTHRTWRRAGRIPAILAKAFIN